MIDRLKARLQGEDVSDELLNEVINTAKDRVTLRVGDKTYPSSLDSITVELALKMYRRLYFEGLASESVDGISQSFIQDIMQEYEAEFKQYIKSKAKKVRFV